MNLSELLLWFGSVLPHNGDVIKHFRAFYFQILLPIVFRILRTHLKICDQQAFHFSDQVFCSPDKTDSFAALCERNTKSKPALGSWVHERVPNVLEKMVFWIKESDFLSANQSGFGFSAESFYRPGNQAKVPFGGLPTVSPSGPEGNVLVGSMVFFIKADSFLKHNDSIN